MDAAVNVSASDPPTAAFELLDRNRFDQAPVTERGTVIGVVTKEALKGAIAEGALPVERIGARLVISADSPIGAAMPRLRDVPILFVVGEGGLAGFVTPSDLNKHPVRTHFYLLLADLEMTMAAVARGDLPHPIDALKSLSDERQAKVLGRHREAELFNFDADVLASFEFADLLTLMKKRALFRRFGYASAKSWGKVKERLVDFRDDVMHPTSDFLGPRTIGDLIEMEGVLRQMLVYVATH
jgi:hypothetical protein